MALTARNDDDFTEALPELLRRIRERAQRSRGQVARRLNVSTVVIYNIETGRTRIELELFLKLLEALRVDPRAVIERHMFSVAGLPELASSEIVKAFRNRLQWSQSRLAQYLGYKSGSMVHHFEKGIRSASLADMTRLMAVAGDNLRGLVAELTGDETFAALFPAGQEARRGEWREYWENFHIPAIRQLMRATAYRDLQRYEPGFFADILAIDYEQEKHALKVLKELGLIRWHKAKPEIVPEARIIIPKNVPRETLDDLKFQGLAFSRRHYDSSPPERALCTMDLLPMNQVLFDDLKARIRAFQDEIHNMKLSNTDGFVYLGWLANYVPIDARRSQGTLS